MNSPILPIDFFKNNNTISLSKKLLGKSLFTNISNNVTGGIIVETEAYCGINDKASHAYNNKKTERTKTMFKGGGVCYVYLCYGIHFLFNIVTGKENIPNAVLIRAIEPIKGINFMLDRRNLEKKCYNITNGPGKLSQALGIHGGFNEMPIQNDTIWIENNKIKIDKKNILSSARIGVDYAKEDAHLPYRFYLKNNKWVSK